MRERERRGKGIRWMVNNNDTDRVVISWVKSDVPRKICH